MVDRYKKLKRKHNDKVIQNQAINSSLKSQRDLEFKNYIDSFLKSANKLRKKIFYVLIFISSL